MSKKCDHDFIHSICVHCLMHVLDVVSEQDAEIARLKEESIGWIKQFRMDSEAINKLEAEYAALKEKVHAASEYVLQIEAWNNEDCDIDIEEMIYDLKQILTEK